MEEVERRYDRVSLEKENKTVLLKEEYENSLRFCVEW